jgi:hypothetical protein
MQPIHSGGPILLLLDKDYVKTEIDIFNNFIWIIPNIVTHPEKLHQYTYVKNNPIALVNRHGIFLGGIEPRKICDYCDHIGLASYDPSTCPCGKWVRKYWYRAFNIWCICYWLCIPQGGVIWSGNPFDLPSTNGIMVHTGKGGLKSGDDCLCKDPDGKLHPSY